MSLPIPYFQREIISANWGCGWGVTVSTKNQEAAKHIGLSIRWGLAPMPLKNGFLYQYVSIKQNYANQPGGCQTQHWHHWPPYIEVWNVTINSESRNPLKFTQQGDDHFCFNRNDLNGSLVINGKKLGDCRIYNAEAWFVEDRKDAPVIEASDSAVTTSGTLLSTDSVSKIKKNTTLFF